MVYEHFVLKISKDGSIVIPSKIFDSHACFEKDSVLFFVCDNPKAVLIRNNII